MYSDLEFPLQNNSSLIANIILSHCLFSGHPSLIADNASQFPHVSHCSVDLGKPSSSLFTLTCWCHVDFLHYCSSLRMWLKVQNEYPSTLLCLECCKMSPLYGYVGMCRWSSFLHIIIPHWILKKKEHQGTDV